MRKSLRKICPYSEIFGPCFSHSLSVSLRIQSECRIHEPENSEYGYFYEVNLSDTQLH